MQHVLFHSSLRLPPQETYLVRLPPCCRGQIRDIKPVEYREARSDECAAAQAQGRGQAGVAVSHGLAAIRSSRLIRYSCLYIYVVRNDFWGGCSRPFEMWFQDVDIHISLIFLFCLFRFSLRVVYLLLTSSVWTCWRWCWHIEISAKGMPEVL